MEGNFLDDDFLALLKSVMITKQDADFDVDNPPRGILSMTRLFYLKEAYLKNNTQAVSHQILAIEGNRKVLRKELKHLFKMFLIMLDGTFDFLSMNSLYFIALFQKYDINILSASPSSPDIIHMFWSFPDIMYEVLKRYPELRGPFDDCSFDDYKNFKPEYKNIGLLGLVPKNKKYGGFVKALIHLGFRRRNNSDSNCFEECLANCRCLYNSSITPHEKREIWFGKLNIKESDCRLWSQTFDQYFPEHTDIYKYFG